MAPGAFFKDKVRHPETTPPLSGHQGYPVEVSWEAQGVQKAAMAEYFR